MNTIAAMEWTEDLALGDERTDVTHQEFVELVNATAACEPVQQLAKFQELLAHTVEHFAQEERWMLATGISADFCHFSQHNNVLDIMREVDRRATAGELDLIPRMLEALVEWFPMHANSMDASLVSYLKEKGYDTRTETLPEGTSSHDVEQPSCGSHEAGHACG